MKSTKAQLKISLMGPFEVFLDGEPLDGFRTAKVQALLAYLVVESHRSWPRLVLADLLWPQLPKEKALGNLRNAISNLRSVLKDKQNVSPFLLISTDSIQYNRKNSTLLDVKVLTDLVVSESKSGVSELRKNHCQNLERALSLYRGDFLEDLYIDSAPFEEWVLRFSQHIRQKVVEAHRLLVEGYRFNSQLDSALKYTRSWLGLEPFDEEARRHLMQILHNQGKRNDALIAYEEYKHQLMNELGVEPSLETKQLYDQIRMGQVELKPRRLNILELPASSQMPAFLRSLQRPQIEDQLFLVREKELERLDRQLAEVIRGEGRIVFVTGDPGSGKTALLAEFSRRAMKKIPDLIVAQSQGNAYTGEADPYFPFREIIQTLAGDLEPRVLGGSITPEHAQRLWRYLPLVINIILDEGTDLINRFVSSRDLLATAQTIQGIKPDLLTGIQALIEGKSQKSIEPQPRKAALLNQFTKVVCSLSYHHPVVLILDDLQWIDTDSVNLLFHLGRRLSGTRILLLGAYRPEDVALGRNGDRHPLAGIVHELQSRFGDIHINLMQNEGTDFVEALIDSEPNQLDLNFRQKLHRHTAGHPLFTIELLRGMQLRGDLFQDEQGRWVESKQTNWEVLPTRVEAVIAERIGHLPDDHLELLNIASVEGEYFTAEILAKISGLEEQKTLRILSQDIGKRHRLVVAQSRKKIGGKTVSLYRFHHILYQKYLYQHLDEVRKIQMHEKMAAVMEMLYRDNFGRYPEITHQLARHYFLSGLNEQAVHYYAESGKYALQLGAHREAITHFSRALQLVKTLPESETRDRQALNLLLALGPSLTATRGWAAPELERNYEQAEKLCHKMGDNAQLVPALWLLSVYRLGRAEHSTVDKLVERFSKMVKTIGDPDLLCLADLQVSQLYQGRLDEARQILTRASLSRDVDQQRSLAIKYGMSPSVVGLAYLAHCLWLMGFSEQAAQRSQEAVDLASEINVPMTTCYAIGRDIWQHAFAGEFEKIPSQADKLFQITQQHELRNYELAANFFAHWASNQAGNLSSVEIEQMYQTMEEYLSLGTVLNRTSFLNLFAQACGKAGLIERGLAALDESIAVGKKTGERWFEAETYRLKGELLLRQATASEQQAANLSQAEECFQTARLAACQQGAKMLELRATTSLCRLWQRQGKGKEGSRMLADILSQFTEGFNGLEISKANELLEELKSG